MFIPECRRKQHSLSDLVHDGVIPLQLAEVLKRYFQGGLIYVGLDRVPDKQQRAHQKEVAYRRLIVFKEQVAVVARELPHGGVSRTTIYKWLKEWKKDDEIHQGLASE